MPSIVALIPARGGSKRVPRKNIRLLAGHPLIAYTIAAAKASGIFTEVLVSSEDAEILGVAKQYGASVIKRPDLFAADESPDIDWVQHAMFLRDESAFAILRPTSPFRTEETIGRAWAEFLRASESGYVDSLRSVKKWEGPHPAKMWYSDGHSLISSFYTDDPGDVGLPTELHSCPTNILPQAYLQTGGLEMAWANRVLRPKHNHDPTIAGYSVVPFFAIGAEEIDINTEEDWQRAERLQANGWDLLPHISEVHADTV